MKENLRLFMLAVLEPVQFYLTAFPSFINPFLLGNYKKLRGLKNKYSGERCFIMGNGPSLKEMPLENLENEYVWGVNRCYLLFDSINWRPQFYTAVDSLVVPDIAGEINQLTVDSPETLFFFPEEFKKKQLIRSSKNILWFRHRNMNPGHGAKGFFSTKVSRYIRTPNTVSITALQLAAYMGFNPIILIGCDTKYVIPQDVDRQGVAIDPRTKEKIEGYEITSTKDNDPNHFTETYFGAGRKWHSPNVRGMKSGYGSAKKVCDTNGISILNATKGGELDVFTRVKFEDLF
jgi:6-hydroxymethylpterin diphosphokinase MptE-like